MNEEYTNLLKENTKLHAQKAQIKDAAEKAIRSAGDVIDKLHKVIDSLIADVVSIIESDIPDSPERTNAIISITNLTPLKIGADGKEIQK